MKTANEIKYDIKMYKENVKGYELQLRHALRDRDWDNVVYWAETIMAREDKIKEREKALKEMRPS